MSSTAAALGGGSGGAGGTEEGYPCAGQNACGVERAIGESQTGGLQATSNIVPSGDDSLTLRAGYFDLRESS